MTKLHHGPEDFSEGRSLRWVGWSCAVFGCANQNVLRKRRSGGFTLIELMIVVVVVAILASIALPSYQESVARGARAEARTVLSEGAQWMERHLSENNRYDQFVGGTAVSTASMPPALIQSPADGVARYNLNVTVAAQSFTLKMVRAGAQANDRCGDFTLNHLGVRAVENYTGFASATAARQECWR